MFLGPSIRRGVSGLNSQLSESNLPPTHQRRGQTLKGKGVSLTLSYRTPIFLIKKIGDMGLNRHSERCGQGGNPRPPFAFKNSMIRGILQFALRIAFRCVLHRCENRDIHGYQLFGGFCMFCGQQRMTSIKVMGSGFEFREPPSVYRGEVSLRRRVSKRASPFTPLRCVCLNEPRP